MWWRRERRGKNHIFCYRQIGLRDIRLETSCVCIWTFQNRFTLKPDAYLRRFFVPWDKGARASVMAEAVASAANMAGAMVRLVASQGT